MNSLLLSLRPALRLSSSSSLLSSQLRGVSGTVKFYNIRKGWGILITKEEKPREIFVHQSTIQMDGFRYLEPGQEVEFEVQKNERGFQAAEVKGKGGAKLNASRDL